MIPLYRSLNEKLQCMLCPNYCVLSKNQFGKCETRMSTGDKIENRYNGVISSSAVDPIEKKPLYHFRPGSSIFSVGFFGCTLKCQFCQNYTISQYHPIKNMERITPSDMVSFLKENSFDQIAFTYSEPTLYFEWVIETAILCRKNGIKSVLVTNGYLNRDPAKELLKHIDAANIDFKSFYDEFYGKVCSGKVEPVKEFIKIAYQEKVHVEVTTLVITDENDSEEEMEKISDFISSISKDIPFHVSRYHPSYKFKNPSTDPAIIDRLISLARKRLFFVYGGNITGQSNTYCKKCSSLLIKRDFYSINILGIDDSGNCKACGENNNIKV